MSTPNQSAVFVSDSGTTFVGPDAVLLVQAITLKAGLRLYARSGIRANRHFSPTSMLQQAASITHKTYKRGAYSQAADDLQIWVDTMKAALPVERAEGRTE